MEWDVPSLRQSDASHTCHDNVAWPKAGKREPISEGWRDRPAAGQAFNKFLPREVTEEKRKRGGGGRGTMEQVLRTRPAPLPHGFVLFVTPEEHTLPPAFNNPKIKK